MSTTILIMVLVVVALLLIVAFVQYAKSPQDPSPSVSAREARARSLAYANGHPDDPMALKRPIYLELFLRNFDIEDEGEALPERLKHLDELRGLGLLSEAEYVERRQFMIDRGYRT
jgi:hypothetical protein